MKKMLVVLMAVVLCVPVTAKSAEENKYDAIVIGAGGGGLAAASKLALGGMKVLVIEQHSKVGGYMGNFERGDYTFEISLHAMDGLDPGMGMNLKTFEDLGILNKLKPIKLDPMYLAKFPDFDVEVPADVNEYIELLKEMFPDEAEGIDGLYKDLEDMNLTMNSLMGLSSGDYWPTIKYVLAHPIRCFNLAVAWQQNLDEFLDEHTQDVKLRAVFTQLAGFAGASPEVVPAVFFGMMWNSYHFGGYYYFEGGSQAISDALAEVIEENGGEILLSTRVNKIYIEDGTAVGVGTKDGKKFMGRYVISNASAPATLFEMVGKEHLPKDYVEKVENMTVGLSCFQVYMGVDKDYSEYFPGHTHEVMINTAYDQEENFANFMEGKPEDASFAIVNYSMADKSAAPEGKNVIVITSILPYDWKDDWHINESYQKYTGLKNETGMIFVRRAEKYLPGLESHIEAYEVGSPRTMEHYTLNPGGSIFGWDNTLDQSLLKRLPQKTPIKNLYLSGAWTFPGGGQSAVLISGEMVGREILKIENE
jgi:all-trans-retinol 13,14-reductase